MKTAEEILNKNMAIDTDSEYKIGLRDTILNSMKEYAIEVAKESLKNASDRARLIANEYDCDCGETHFHWNMDKQSILNESNIPKL